MDLFQLLMTRKTSEPGHALGVQLYKPVDDTPRRGATRFDPVERSTSPAQYAIECTTGKKATDKEADSTAA